MNRIMKSIIWALLFSLITTPAWGAKKITVGQLEDLLRSLQQDKKNDAEVATALKQVELTEELTRSTMNSLVSYVPGPLSTEQIYVLEARSADLIPPETDLPKTAAPDEAAQKVMLDKAALYVKTDYDQLPALTATRTTLRFQDNVEAVSGGSGLQGGAQEVVTSAGFSNPATFVHYINSTQAQIASLRGAEKLPAEKDKTRWGANGMISLDEPIPSLGVIFREAQSSGTLRWLRWELINGKTAAVYSFNVDSRKARLPINVCCFPKINQAGIATFYSATTAQTLGGGGSGGGGVNGNFQTTTEWNKFSASVPYHGELFIDPDMGVVVRMIVQPELKTTDLAHQVDTRVDYGPVKVGNRTLVVPMKTFVITEVVPKGDSGAGTYTTRCTLFTSEYKDYKFAEGK